MTDQLRMESVNLYADRELQHGVATVQAPAFPNLPELICYQGRYFMGAETGYGTGAPDYYEVHPFEAVE